MNTVIDYGSLNSNKKEWGEIVKLTNGKELGSKNVFSLDHVMYRKPHYSGYHDDIELIIILKGKGKAKVGGEEQAFCQETVLVIPPKTEHEISMVEEEPIDALLIHIE